MIITTYTNSHSTDTYAFENELSLQLKPDILTSPLIKQTAIETIIDQSGALPSPPNAHPDTKFIFRIRTSVIKEIGPKEASPEIKHTYTVKYFLGTADNKSVRLEYENPCSEEEIKILRELYLAIPMQGKRRIHCEHITTGERFCVDCKKGKYTIEKEFATPQELQEYVIPEWLEPYIVKNKE